MMRISSTSRKTVKRNASHELIFVFLISISKLLNDLEYIGVYLKLE